MLNINIQETLYPSRFLESTHFTLENNLRVESIYVIHSIFVLVNTLVSVKFFFLNTMKSLNFQRSIC